MLWETRPAATAVLKLTPSLNWISWVQFNVKAFTNKDHVWLEFRPIIGK